MAETRKKTAGGRMKLVRHLLGLGISLTLAVLGTLVASNVAAADAWKYVFGIIIFLFSAFLSLYYELCFWTLPEIKEVTTEVSNEFGRRVSLIDTFSQISKHSPEASSDVLD